jgi:hypothetical protein
MTARFRLASLADSLVKGLPRGSGCPLTGDTGLLSVSVIDFQLLLHTVNMFQQVFTVMRASGFQFFLGLVYLV